MREFHFLQAQNAALSRSFIQIHVKTVLCKIQHRKEKFLKIAVVSAVKQQCTFSFTLCFCHHNRQMTAAVRHFMLLYDTFVEIVAVIIIKQFTGFGVTLLFLRIGIIYEKLRHTKICDLVGSSALCVCFFGKLFHCTYPIRACLYVLRYSGNLVSISAVPHNNTVELKIEIRIAVQLVCTCFELNYLRYIIFFHLFYSFIMLDSEFRSVRTWQDQNSAL